MNEEIQPQDEVPTEVPASKTVDAPAEVQPASAHHEPSDEFNEAEAIIDEITGLLQELKTSERFKFLTEKFASKFPDKVENLNSVVKSIADGFVKSLEIK